MSKHPIVALALFFGLVPAFWFGWRQPVLAEKSEFSQPFLAPGSGAVPAEIKLIPTAAPERTPSSVENNQVIQATDYRLLQTMILLAVLIMIVIFWGVWSNRDHPFLR